MIEFKNPRNKFNLGKSELIMIGQVMEEYDLFHDGKLIDDVKVLFRYGIKAEEIHITAGNREAGKLILSEIESIRRATEKKIKVVVKNWETEGKFFVDKIYVEFEDKNVSKEIDTTFRFKYDLKSWNYSFSFDDYYIEFSRIDGIRTFAKNIVESNKEAVVIDLDCGLEENDKSLLDKILASQNIVLKFHTEAVDRLVEAKEVLLAEFNFPEEIKVYCKQYLEYFAKFLEDLGINATSDSKEKAGKVLFSIKPTDDVEALDKIRESLAVYLNLPASPISDLEYSENFALMRLQQQVRNLQHSQQMAKTELLSAQYALGLAQSNIENQDQIIVRQHSTIENLNKVIEKITSNSIMTDSLDKKDKEEFEEICEGLRVGESKWLRELTGVGLSTGKFVKAIVKHTFGKEEKNSILGLDEE